MVHSDTEDHPIIGPSELSSLWIEMPANCTLFCPMCFANTSPHLKERAPQPISDTIYESIIRDFERMPSRKRKSIAIPGAGEPFHQFNAPLTWKFIRWTGELRIPLTLFTTAHLMSDDDIERLRGYEHVMLLVKFNSLRRDVQEKLVFRDYPTKTDPTYFKRRKTVFAKLIKAGFNKRPATEDEQNYGFTTRLGIVTSIMEDNLFEIDKLLQYARRNNLIFDCDTILPRGRGVVFSKHHEKFCGVELDNEIKKKIEKLQNIDFEKYGVRWEMGGTYVGAACTRFRNHLYIDLEGEVHPCIGATTVSLGNVVKYIEGDLVKIWDHPAMQVVRQRRYAGVCPTCKNFGLHCHSCLGRSTVNDDVSKALTKDVLERKGAVFTRGCLNYRPGMADLTYEKSLQLKAILIGDRTGTAKQFHHLDQSKLSEVRYKVEEGRLEDLWVSEKSRPAKHDTEAIIVYKDNFLPDLQAAPWRWHQKDKDIGQVLPSAYLPVISRFFEKDVDEEQMLLWCNLLLYDEVARSYFFRLVLRGQSTNQDAWKTILLSRWAEAKLLFNEQEEAASLYSNTVLDLSDVLRDKNKNRFDYRLVLKGTIQPSNINNERDFELGIITFDLRRFYDLPAVKRAIEKIDQVLDNALEKQDGFQLVDVVRIKRLRLGNEQDSAGWITPIEAGRLKSFYGELAETFKLNEKEIWKTVDVVDKDLVGFVNKSSTEKGPTSEKIRKLLNYLLYLGAMNRDLAGYEVRHCNNHEGQGVDPSGIIFASCLSKNELRIPLSKEILHPDLVAQGLVAMNMLSLPITRIYDEKKIKNYERATTRHELTTRFGAMLEEISGIKEYVTTSSIRDITGRLSMLEAEMKKVRDICAITILLREKRDISEFRRRMPMASFLEWFDVNVIDTFLRRLTAAISEKNPFCYQEVVKNINCMGINGVNIIQFLFPDGWKQSLLIDLYSQYNKSEKVVDFFDIMTEIATHEAIFNLLRHARSEGENKISMEVKIFISNGYVFLRTQNSITRGQAEDVLKWNTATHTYSTGRELIDSIQKLCYDKSLNIPKKNRLTGDNPIFDQEIILAKIEDQGR